MGEHLEHISDRVLRCCVPKPEKPFYQDEWPLSGPSDFVLLWLLSVRVSQVPCLCFTSMRSAMFMIFAVFCGSSLLCLWPLLSLLLTVFGPSRFNSPSSSLVLAVTPLPVFCLPCTRPYLWPPLPIFFSVFGLSVSSPSCPWSFLFLSCLSLVSLSLNLLF